VDAQQIKQLIQSQLPDSEVFPSGEGCNFRVTVVSEVFAGMMPVKKQQLVYSYLTKYITDGRIHAIGIKTYTPQQWQQQR
jgi:acid stress-induced BolA-like protein IbaG/YrbA